jgi:hypothetical protein
MGLTVTHMHNKTHMIPSGHIPPLMKTADAVFIPTHPRTFGISLGEEKHDPFFIIDAGDIFCLNREHLPLFEQYKTY